MPKKNVQHKCPLHPPPLFSVSTDDFRHQIPPNLSVQERSNGVANLNSFHPVRVGQNYPFFVRDADKTQEVRHPTTHEVVDPSVVPQEERNVLPNLQQNPQIPPSKDFFASNASTIVRLIKQNDANTLPRKSRCLARRIRRVCRKHNPLSPAPSTDTQKFKFKFNFPVTIERNFPGELVIKSIAIKLKNNA
uniref:Uncharacterized protein n=1 Tax=Panagrolaimus sp. PS1159 TaxID=55785 RepID=A0AC35FJP6_9BILA